MTVERFEIDTDQWAVVPRVPTDEMLHAAARTRYGWENGGGAGTAHAVEYFDTSIRRSETLEHGALQEWRAMLNKAPQPEQTHQADGAVISHGTMVSEEFLECFDCAFSFLANGHSIGQCFDMMKFARTALLKSQKNQCDGCMAGHELVDGKHYKGKTPYMACQKHRHAAAPRPEPAQQPAQPLLSDEQMEKEYKYAMCPAGCGCLWRDNSDGTMSLAGPNSRSCYACEPMIWDELTQLSAQQQPAQPIPTGERLRDALNQAIELLVTALHEPSQITEEEIHELRSIEIECRPTHPEQPKPVAYCEWALNDPDYGVWVTKCGEAHILAEGNPEQNSMKFCCYCGGNLADATPTEAGE